MNIAPYILNDVKPLSIDNKVKEAQLVFNQLTFSHIPITQNGVYLGCLSETDSHCFDADKTINEYKYALEQFFVRAQTNWIDVLEAFAQNSSNVMPILNEKNDYIGYYELNDIINVFNDTPFLHELGSVLVVEKGMKDYSFSEISQIVESNNARLLGAFISKIENDVVQVTLKLNNAGLNEIVQSFRRYSYNIVSEFEEDAYIQNLKERSEYLTKYLNI
ncbi:acetoin utilization protein acuB [Kordia sp. YSTF-M3]|uniref:Acetoin utilization protein acuB n=1 Tax=Kordia aestuariivivens TaxID=2759037 RepID=A0ABR7Q3J4_9FLAO|nr:acetoin utilization protein acuB [Kordia aestuariivivens]MBC8753121.1 acetoin utilization protein acuB [Kordia aestuariivivens]